MNFIIQHILQILSDYSGKMPLANFLKLYYKKQPKLGSRDRKAISEAVYLYFRCAPFTLLQHPVAIIAQGIQWCGTKQPFLQKVIAQQRLTVHPESRPNLQLARQNIPFSTGITETEWLTAHMQQPDLFIRLRRNAQQAFISLEKAGVKFQIQRFENEQNNNDNCCLSLPNHTKVAEILSEGDYVIQDLSSQTAIQTALAYRNKNKMTKTAVWDACAGAGGKSIYWKEHFPEDNLLATDNRKNILSNLKIRFQLYGIDGFRTKVADATKLLTNSETFDYIICDVPCSGSGTWARTPEQFTFFQTNRLNEFQELQYAIAFQTQKKLHSGGYLFYITCSVFRGENECVTERLSRETKLKLVQQQLINGITRKADNMFIAIFQQT